MALSHEGTNGEWICIEPGDVGGPWTINLPDTGLNGYWVGIKDVEGDATAVTVTALGGATVVEDPSTPGTTSASVTLNFTNISAIKFMYSAGLDQWLIVSTARPDV